MIKLRDDPNKQFNEARSAAVFAEDANFEHEIQNSTFAEREDGERIGRPSCTSYQG